MKRVRAWVLGLFLAATVGASAPALSAPVPPKDAVALDLRRTTLVVRNLERSLKFYRDALGMQVVYDHVIRTPRDAKSDAEASKSLRLVLLRANDDFVGMLGLMEYTKPTAPPRPDHARDGVLAPGDIVLLFNTKDLASRFENAKASPGVAVSEAPHPTTYPSYDGKGVINVMFSSLYDPDGHYVELNQVLDDKLH